MKGTGTSTIARIGILAACIGWVILVGWLLAHS